MTESSHMQPFDVKFRRPDRAWQVVRRLGEIVNQLLLIILINAGKLLWFSRSSQCDG
jgi:hypothetical protein